MCFHKLHIERLFKTCVPVISYTLKKKKCIIFQKMENCKLWVMEVDKIILTPTLCWSRTLIHLKYAVNKFKVCAMHGQSRWQVLHCCVYTIQVKKLGDPLNI